MVSWTIFKLDLLKPDFLQSMDFLWNGYPVEQNNFQGYSYLDATGPCHSKPQDHLACMESHISRGQLCYRVCDYTAACPQILEVHSTRSAWNTRQTQIK